MEALSIIVHYESSVLRIHPVQTGNCQSQIEHDDLWAVREDLHLYTKIQTDKNYHSYPSPDCLVLGMLTANSDILVTMMFDLGLLIPVPNLRFPVMNMHCW